MPQINVGLLPDDGTGDTLRTTGLKINQWGQLNDKTVNAAFYKTAAISNEAAITLAITAAGLLGTGAVVWIPASMLPYDASLVTFSSAVQMFREGGLANTNDIKAFGAAGDGVRDDTQNLLKAKQWAIARLPCTLNITRGTYLYNGVTLGNMAYKGLTLLGDGIRESVLKCTSAGVAYTADAFQAGFTGNDATAPYVDQCGVQGITIQGNAGTTVIVFLQGIARSEWDINVREAEPTAGLAFDFRAVQLNIMSVRCSTDIQAMTSIPYEGLRLSSGVRNAISVGNSTNNVFLHTRLTGLTINGRYAGADQTTFVGGSFESGSLYGLIIAAGSRFNQFLGTGFEQKSTATADISDGGLNNIFSGIYASVNLLLQGRSTQVNGGFFERIELQSSAERCRISDCLVKHWTFTGGGVGAGGLFDSGVGTFTQNIYDEVAVGYIASRNAAFLAYNSVSDTNQTGAGAVVTVDFDTEVFDQDDDFLNDTFTAPITARYQLDAHVSLDLLSTAATIASIRIVTTNRTYIQDKGLNPKAGALQTAMAISCVADMAVGNTAIVQVVVSGMAGNTITILGHATSLFTTFSGHLIR